MSGATEAFARVGEPAGTRREASAVRFVEFVDAGGEERPGCARVTVRLVSARNRVEGGASRFETRRGSMS